MEHREVEFKLKSACWRAFTCGEMVWLSFLTERDAARSLRRFPAEQRLDRVLRRPCLVA
jgi:hypothetical protein